LRVVTTCHRAGWEQYGEKCLNGLKLWPKEAEFVWYSEGFDLPARPYVREVKNETLEPLEVFKEQWRHYHPPDWRFDVVRFANKAFALYDGLRNHDGFGVWMDADIVTTKRIQPGYLRKLLPEGCYIALFQRDGMHSEVGLVLFDCSHPQHEAFMDYYIGLYESGRFKEAHEWHDAVMMDITLRAFERNGLVKSHNLSGKNSNIPHPMAVHDFAKHADHLKGPKRKALGRSPERRAT
jgi:hypothetical protein